MPDLKKKKKSPKQLQLQPLSLLQLPTFRPRSGLREEGNPVRVPRDGLGTPAPRLLDEYCGTRGPRVREPALRAWGGGVRRAGSPRRRGLPARSNSSSSSHPGRPPGETGARTPTRKPRRPEPECPGAEVPAGGAQESRGRGTGSPPPRHPPHKGPRGGRPQAPQPRPRVPASAATHR